MAEMIPINLTCPETTTAGAVYMFSQTVSYDYGYASLHRETE